MNDPVNVKVIMDFLLNYYHNIVRDLAGPELGEFGLFDPQFMVKNRKLKL